MVTHKFLKWFGTKFMIDTVNWKYNLELKLCGNDVESLAHITLGFPIGLN